MHWQGPASLIWAQCGILVVCSSREMTEEEAALATDAAATLIVGGTCHSTWHTVVAGLLHQLQNKLTDKLSGNWARCPTYYTMCCRCCHRYHVPQLLCVLLKLLGELLQRTTPSWPAVMFILNPHDDGISRHPDSTKPYQLAYAHTLRQLSDLEAVLQGFGGLQQVLVALPYHVLLRLVGSPHTRVAYESTVVEAISTW